jgi:phosphoglucosamine mutase
MTNLGLEQAFVKLGIPFKRTQVGDRYVLAELMNSDLKLGGEPSGHIVNLGLNTTGDGIISALQVLSAVCQNEKSLHELKEGVQKFPQVLINVKSSRPDLIIASVHIQEAIKEAELKLGKKGRVLLRASGTEPIVRVMVEGEEQAVVQSLAAELAAVVEKQQALN